jgi:predicted phosphodiesterase
MDRRHFLRNTTLAAMAGGTAIARAGAPAGNDQFPAIRIGICADLHQDIMHDAPRRLQAFIDEMHRQKPDLILQMGDFCTPIEKNRVILDIWEKFRGPRYHVIGNHDTDGGFTREQVVEFWNAPGKYYSFDQKGYHFVVLDGNEKRPGDTSRGYGRYITDPQLKWLEADLDKTELPVLVFCHQGWDNDIAGILNATKCRLVLERANTKAGRRKVQAVFSGHHHQDYHNTYNGIHYIQINSMSYYWVGEEHPVIRYGESVDKEHPAIKYTAPYKDPLWAIMDISRDGTLQIRGQRSEFVGPSPEEMGGMDIYAMGYTAAAYISDRKIPLTAKPFEYSNR